MCTDDIVDFFSCGYPHTTEEYKKYQIIEKQFQHCVDLAMRSIEKMEFIEQQCNAMKSALLNWNPTMTTNNEGPSVRNSRTARENRYRSAAETYGCGTNRRRPRPDDPVEGGEHPHPAKRARRRGPRGRGESVARPNELVEGGGRGLGEPDAGPNEPVAESGCGQGDEGGRLLDEGDGFPFDLNAVPIFFKIAYFFRLIA
ncbi:hypothetical protein ACS0TY_012112 [Phlomoides rotata]